MIGAAAVVAALATTFSPEDVAARVDATAVTRADLIERMTELKSRGLPSTPQSALESVALDILLSGEATRTGLASAPATRARVEREQRRLALTEMLRREATAAQATEADLRRMYHLTSDSVRMRTHVFSSEALAAEALAAIRKSGRFEDGGAKALNVFSAIGGDQPQIRGQLPGLLADAVFGAQIGAILGPIKLESGWCVVKVIDRTVGDEAGFATRRASLETFARQERSEMTKRHIAQRLREKAHITTDDRFLDGLGKRTEATTSELDHVVAVVNGQKIRYRDIEPTIRDLSRGSGHAAGPMLRRQILTNEIEAFLMEAAAWSSPAAKEAAVTARLPAAERRALAGAMVDSIGASLPAPTNKEIKAFYKAYAASSGRPLEELRPQLIVAIMEKRREEALQGKVRELRSRARVVVDEAILGSVTLPSP